MKLECPHCGSVNEIPKEDWPDDCSTTEQRECLACEETFGFGVTCEIEVR